MQIYGIRMYNFCRFGETCNSIVLDVSPENMARLNDDDDSFTMDELYDILRQDPLKYVEEVKGRGITDLLAICGMKGDNYDRSNGVGKSTTFEAICYAHYDRIVRRSVNTDKVQAAGLSVVTKFNGEYPKDLRESFVEEIFEEKGKLYRIKRGRTFTDSQKSNSPVLEFECFNDANDEFDGQSHRTGDTNGAIAQITPWDYDVFVNGAMFAQNDSGKFLTGTDKIRKEMLINLLSLEDIVIACLEKIRKRKNEKGKANDNLVAQVDILKENIKERETPEELEEKIKSYQKTIAESDKKIDKLQEETDVLSKSDAIKKVASIKEEGSKVKTDITTQEEQKESQVKEWESLHAETVKKEKIQEEKIETFIGKRKKLKAEILQKTEWVEKFDMSTQEEELKKVEKAKGAKDGYVSKVAKIRETKEKVVKDIASLETDAKRHKLEFEALESQIKNVEGDNFVCDKCKSTVSREHIQKEVQTNKELYVVAETKMNELSKGKSQADTELEEADRRLNIINDWLIKEEKIKANIKEYDTTKAELEKLQKQEGEEFEDTTKELQGELESLQKQAKDYQVKVTEISLKYDDKVKELKAEISKIVERYKEAQKVAEDVQSKIDELKKQKDEIISSKATANSQIGSATKEIETIKGEVKKIETLEKELDAGKLIYNRLLILEDVFGLEGIQTRIVKKYLPLLNVYIKEFLDILSNGEMTVELFINSRSKVDIKIGGGSADSYVMLSGGEKILVKLAVDIGLALLSFSRCAQKPEIICLDEIFGQLDNFNTRAVFTLLQNLRTRFSRVILISHESEINDSIPHKIFLEKEDGDFGRSKFRSIT